MKILTVAIVGLASAMTFAADPEISNVSLAKNTDGSVTVSYELSETAVVTAELFADGTGLDGRIQVLEGDVFKKVEGGMTRSFVWHPERTWRGHSAAEVKAKVRAWRLDNPPDYLVASLVSCEGDGLYYYPSTNFFPGGILEDERYRITMMPFKKIRAKGVTWQMGSTTEIGRTTSDEREKAHEVTLSTNFYMAVFQFTAGQAVSVGASKPEAYGPMKPDNRKPYSLLRGSSCYPGDTPAASSIIGMLNDATGLACDLPLESEWEYAARGGYGEGFWGDGSAILSKTHDTNADRLVVYKYTENALSNTGLHAPNGYGLYDMGGNVQEYCQDWYQTDITGLRGALCADENDHSKLPGGETAGTSVVVRGTPYYGSGADGARPAYRNPVPRGNYYGEKGSRLRTYAGLGEIGVDPSAVESGNSIAVDTTRSDDVTTEAACDVRRFTLSQTVDFVLDSFAAGFMLLFK